ncbi:MAG: hypothetical protein NXI01_00750 [Gammaproteobacteria bacterium]|nr:hypothetical protein [Gammaproteobacteria bacterium]
MALTQEQIKKAVQDAKAQEAGDQAITPNAGKITKLKLDEKDKERDIISLFKEHFGAKPGFKEPVVNPDGSISFSFPKKGDAESFCLDVASQGHQFLIANAEGKVMGYSNGDGKFYHADGSEFQAGDELQPSTTSIEDFKNSEPRRPFGGS